LPLPASSPAQQWINLRTGPGSNYPIVWIYQRRGMPVE
jgi:SH3-like domain-containing protein